MKVVAGMYRGCLAFLAINFLAAGIQLGLMVWLLSHSYLQGPRLCLFSKSKWFWFVSRVGVMVGLHTRQSVGMVYADTVVLTIFYWGFFFQTELLASCASDRSIILYDMREAAPLKKVCWRHTPATVFNPFYPLQEYIIFVSVFRLSWQWGATPCAGIRWRPIISHLVMKTISEWTDETFR